METKRLILAIVLSFAVLFLYQLLFVKKAPETQGPAVGPVAAAVEPAAKPPAPSVSPEPIPPAPEVRPGEAVSGLKEEELKVATSLYRAVWSSKGAVLKSFLLRNHRNERKEDLELVPAAAGEVGVFPFALLEDADPDRAGLEAIASSPANLALYKLEGASLDLRDGQRGELKFVHADGRGLEVEKIFRFHGGRYDFEVAITVRRNGQAVEPRVLWGPGIGNPSSADLAKRFGSGGGVSVLSGTNFYRVDERKYKPETSAFNYLTWAAYDDNYFTALFVPAKGAGSAAYLRLAGPDDLPFFYLAAANPGKAFLGPKEIDTLTAFGHEAKKIVRFGMFGFVTEILYASIKVIHRAIPNWGFAIIVLTFVIKIIFFPLTYSSTKSMSKMAELQPKIKALRAKYKKSKTDIQQRRAMNEEMMKLYKEHGVNPAGGCLPLLIQLPVFWGFFRLLTVAIEFRHSPWMLWVKDLSAKDPLFITPILMGITQFISQKMTPTSADPSQARMMLIMPAVMTLFFLNFQSGLVLYWLTSNVLQIGQQALMNKLMKKKKSQADGKRRKT
ncbi:MAG: membrane protein insertase YidC [Candidatus Aminicenantes bacterium]|nr:membrane protein insertase YidC [Candidatus Aminicenantes bacterium]